MSVQGVEVIHPVEGPALVLPAEQAYVTEMPTGLLFRPDTPIDLWAGLVMRLLRQHKAIEWAIADAINFGERRYGEVYSQWIDETGLSKRTLANIAWVGRSIECSRRREHVSFAHHAEVASLPRDEQESLLEAAERAGMTRYELRDAVRERKEQLNGRAARLDGTPIQEPESLVWVPQRSDLTDEARQEVERRLAVVGKRHAIGYERAWLDCLLFTEQREFFREWRND